MNTKELKPGKNDVAIELCSFWKEQRAHVDKANKPWQDKSRNIIRRFRDDRDGEETKAFRRMNVLWANVKILKPALYGKTPIPVIERKFLDRDPKGRLSAQILQRAVANEIENNGYHNSISRAVDDYLLPGRGVVWARYEPEIGESESIPSAEHGGMEDDFHKALEGKPGTAAGDEDIKVKESDDKSLTDDKEEKLESTNEVLIAERTPLDYIDYRDFRVYPSNARTWEEVQAVSKTVHMSKVEAIERFGEEIGRDMKADTSYEDATATGSVSMETRTYRDSNLRNIIVEEIWNKIDRKIYWVCTGYQGICDIKEDFLKLKCFFPTPEPISATLTNDSVIPVPDYQEYQDQAVQIDELTQRISLLTKACKVVGTYNAESDEIKRLLEEGFENQLIAVDNWAIFAEKGGVEGGISFLPLDTIQTVIKTLIEVRQLCMQDMDLITGISDIVRGTTDSRETLGGIRLKNNNSGTRLTDRQNQVARFAKDAIAIIAEIMAKHYDNKTLIEQSGILLDDELQPETIINELKAGKDADKQLKPEPQNQPPQNPPQPPQTPGAPPQQPGAPPLPVVPHPQQGMAAPPPVAAPQSQMMPQPPQMGGGGMPIHPQGIDPAIQEQIIELQLQEQAESIIQEKVKGALELLRDDLTRNYRIDIETDSTVYGDAMQERQDATEFVTAVTTFMEKAGMMAQMMPGSEPLLGRMLQWAVRKFRTGRDLESAIDSFVAKMEQVAKDNKDNPKTSPEEQKAQMDMQMKQQEIAHQQQMQQMESKAQESNDQRDIMKQQMDDQRQQQLMQMEMAMKQKEMELKQQEMEMKKQLLLLQHQLDERKLQMESAHQERDMQMKTEQSQQQHALAMHQSQQQFAMDQQKHQQSIEANNQKHKLGMEANQQKSQMMKEQAAIKAKQPKKKKAA